mgnify:CR=1 FL=1
MTPVIKSFGWAMHGLATVWREERNFRIQTILGVVVVAIGAYLHFSFLEWIIIIGCIASVLSAEIVNTAVEDLCNKIEPNTDPVIGKIKDIMAGFVFVVCLGATVVGAIVVYARVVSN